MSDFSDRRPPPAADTAAQRRYATSGKIMLSAIVVLFAVVVIMLCLHLYARFYFLRRRRRLRHGRRTHFFFYVDSAAGEAPATAQNSGLDQRVLKSLPIFTFSDVAGDGDEGFVECAVCLSEFEDEEKGRKLPKCGHCFHVDCIDMWFHSHSTCPLCRTAVDGGLMKGEEGIQPGNVIAGESTRTSSGESTRTSSGESAQEGVRAVGGECRPGSSSFKSGLVGVSVEVPMRSASFSFGTSDGLGPSSPASQGFRSPTSRLLALRRMLSRERKPASPSSSARAGADGYELAEMEEGRVETRTSQAPSGGDVGSS